MSAKRLSAKRLRSPILGALLIGCAFVFGSSFGVVNATLWELLLHLDGAVKVNEPLFGGCKPTATGSLVHMHFSLVLRGDADKADAYVKVQDDYLKAHPIVNEPAKDGEGKNG